MSDIKDMEGISPKLREYIAALESRIKVLETDVAALKTAGGGN